MVYYYSLNNDELYKELNVSNNGLTDEEAKKG